MGGVDQVVGVEEGEEWRVGGRGDVRAEREGSWEVDQPNQGASAGLCIVPHLEQMRRGVAHGRSVCDVASKRNDWGELTPLPLRYCERSTIKNICC